jgi:hypothetical protein
MIDQVRSASLRPRAGPSGRQELDERVERLSFHLRAHNRREEELLRGMLATVDAWGPVRVEIMDERHAAEHADLLEGIAKIGSSSTFEDRVIWLERLLMHMAVEEHDFLTADVLCDDSVVVDQVSG